MTSFGRSVIVFLIGALMAGGVLWLIKPSHVEPITWSQLTENEIKNQVENASRNEVIDFVNWAQSKSWEASTDIIPAYVANAGGIRKARAAVETRYPQFTGKSGDHLVEAVRRAPLEYLRYCNELLAVDRFYVRN